MATNLGAVTISGTKMERTCRATIEARLGADPRIVVERELVTLDGSGALIVRQAVPAVVRHASLLGAASVTLQDGTVLTEAQIIAALPMFFDAWAAADRADPPPRDQ